MWFLFHHFRHQDKLNDVRKNIHKPIDNIRDNILYTVPESIKFAYYHCTSIDYSVLCEWSTLYFESTTQYYTLVLCYHVKGIQTLLWLQYKVVLYAAPIIVCKLTKVRCCKSALAAYTV